jgi:hypothetical protein
VVNKNDGAKIAVMKIQRKECAGKIETKTYHFLPPDSILRHLLEHERPISDIKEDDIFLLYLKNT